MWVNPRPTPQDLVLYMGTPVKNWVSSRTTHCRILHWSCSAPSTPTSLVTMCCYINMKGLPHRRTDQRILGNSWFIIYLHWPIVSIVTLNMELWWIGAQLSWCLLAGENFLQFSDLWCRLWICCCIIQEDYL